MMLLLTNLSRAQDACLPRYALPVQKTSVEGLQLAYVEEGKGAPILFIHGLGGNLSHWSKNLSVLAERFHVLAVDLPGYGRSDKQFATGEKDQLQFYADVIISFIKQKGLKNVVLAGHSMGAQIALIAALQHGSLISKLILLAPAGLEVFSKEEAAMLMNATPASFFQNQNEAAIRYGFKQNFYTQPAEAEILIQDRIRLKECPDFSQYTQAVSNGIRGMLQHLVKEELSKIKQPVLIMFGEMDALIPNKMLHPALKRDSLLKETAMQMPSSTVITIHEAGHFLQFEKPTEVNKAIMNFLK
jgi:pimeloyl-ACP methyl ester carboxylesterase